MLLVASALFFGAALSLRHDVFVLIPGSLLTAVAAFAFSFTGGDSFGVALLVTTVAVAALQSGYLAGVTIFRRDVDDVKPDASIVHTYGGVNVVYLNRRWLAKTR